MSTFSESYFPPPRGWDALEGLVFDVFTRRLFNPSMKRYGRSGQEQRGVDIIGSVPEGHVGIQCKNHPGTALSLAETNDEVAKAEKFTPALSHYIIVTSAVRDAVLTRYAFALSEARKQEGKFTVEVFFWEDLCHELTRYPDLVRRHYPDLAHAEDVSQPQLNVLFANGEREVTLAADWEERKAGRKPYPPSRNGVSTIPSPWMLAIPPKHPGTTLLQFRIENLRTMEAKNVRVEIEYPKGGSMVYVSALPTELASEKAIKRGEHSVVITLESLLHRPGYETGSIYFVFPFPNTTYDLHWTATAGNMLHEAKGIIQVHVLGKEVSPTKKFPSVEK